MAKIKSGELYRHYKGDEYRIVTVATHTENHKSYIVYQALYDGRVWVRPLNMFKQSVTFNGKKVKRFERINERG